MTYDPYPTPLDPGSEPLSESEESPAAEAWGESATDRQRLAFLVVCTMFTLVLRATPLRRSLWYDELYSWVHFINVDWLATITTYRAANNHPLYSLFARVCFSLLQSDWSLRLPAFVAGVLLVYQTYRLTARFSWLTQRLATLMVAVHPLLVVHSTEARGYAGASAACLALLAQINVRDGRFRRPLVALLVLLSVWQHPASLLLVLLWPVGVAWADQLKGRELLRSPLIQGWGIGMTVSLLVYLKILKRLWSFARRHVLTHAPGPGQPGVSALETLGNMVYGSTDALAGSALSTTNPGVLIIQVALLGLCGYGLVCGLRQEESVPLRRLSKVTLAVLPGLLFWFLPGTFYMPRFSVFFLAPILIFAAVGLIELRRLGNVGWGAMVAQGCIVAALGSASWRMTPMPLQEIRGALERARSYQQSHPGAVIVTVSLGAELLQDYPGLSEAEGGVPLLDLSGQERAFLNLVQAPNRKDLVVIEVYADQSVGAIRECLDAASRVRRERGIHGDVRIVVLPR